ncbi:hypothetical protein [Enhydrobacter sp.]|jgi:hypothetical protein|uniref:hypothetical protein n=1 Tax=Enhydrobacter sp. TaxID=1894999 RepID=UPI0026356F87|nr:hypothetical protein [Enhydrobacter sp.]WIM09774.1 MAG: hypothetical protein OJF58_000727 [Enhydrobacter sp.]
MGAREKITELVAFVAELTDVDQRRACLAELDQLLLAERPTARERPQLLMTRPAGGMALVVGRSD